MFWNMHFCFEKSLCYNNKRLFAIKNIISNAISFAGGHFEWVYRVMLILSLTIYSVY